eukprot:PhF_6_TR34941/c0_g1_i1/m.50662
MKFRRVSRASFRRPQAAQNASATDHGNPQERNRSTRRDVARSILEMRVIVGGFSIIFSVCAGVVTKSMDPVVIFLSVLICITSSVLLWLCLELYFRRTILSLMLEKCQVTVPELDALSVLIPDEQVKVLESLTQDMRANLHNALNAVEELKGTDSSEKSVHQQKEMTTSLIAFQAATTHVLLHTNSVLDVVTESIPSTLDDEVNIRDLLRGVLSSCTALSELRNNKLGLYVEPRVPSVVMSDTIVLHQLCVQILCCCLESVSGSPVGILCELGGSSINIIFRSMLCLPDTIIEDTREFTGAVPASLGLYLAQQGIARLGGELKYSNSEDHSNLSIVLPYAHTISRLALGPLGANEQNALVAVDEYVRGRGAILSSVATRVCRDHNIRVVRPQSLEHLGQCLRKPKDSHSVLITSSTLLKNDSVAADMQKVEIARKIVVCDTAEEIEQYSAQGWKCTTSPLIGMDLESLIIESLAIGDILLEGAHGASDHANPLQPTNSQNMLKDQKLVHVILADGSSINRLVLERQLRHVCVRPVCVCNTEELLRAYKQNKWDVALIDFDLPSKGGVSAAEACLQIDTDMRRTPAHFVALSSMAPQKTQMECKDTPFHMFICRPTLPQDIRDCFVALHQMDATAVVNDGGSSPSNKVFSPAASSGRQGSTAGIIPGHVGKVKRIAFGKRHSFKN